MKAQPVGREWRSRLRVALGALVVSVVAVTAPGLAAGAVPARDDYASIFSDGSLVGAGWATCPDAIVWDADVTRLSARAGKFALADLEWAIGEWAKAAGLAVRRGAVGQLTYDNSSAVVTGPGGGRKLFVKFVPDKDSTYLSGRVVGVATPTKVIPQAPEITGGSAAFRSDYVEYASKSESRALLLHEIGHALGLGHAKAKSSVMYPIVATNMTLSPGDIAGIRAFVKGCDPSLDPMRR